jgi:arginase family enzyme
MKEAAQGSLSQIEDCREGRASLDNRRRPFGKLPAHRTFERYAPLTIVLFDAHLNYRDRFLGLEYTNNSPFRRAHEVTAKEIGALFGFQPRTAALLCQRWTESGFLKVTDPAKKSRRYRLNDVYEAMLGGEGN